MARIHGYSFGRVLVDGEEHTKDVIVMPGSCDHCIADIRSFRGAAQRGPGFAAVFRFRIALG